MSAGIRDTLFGDMPIDQWPHGEVSTFPWGKFIEARNQLAAGNKLAAIVHWKEILDLEGLESRHYLQAWHFLRQEGEMPRPEVAKQLLGVVVEVSMEHGMDLVAAYADHTARYYNYSGGGIAWDHPDASLHPLIDGLLRAGRLMVRQINPSEEARPEQPTKGQLRLSFLTPSGLHYGERSMEAISTDPMAGPVFASAFELMRGLLAKMK